MSRYHSHRVDSALVVECADGAPVWFRWRGRDYVVCAVLEHWFFCAAWWDRPQSPVGNPGSSGELLLEAIPASPKWAQRAWGEPAPDVGAAAGPPSAFDAEREFWRVEAQRAHPSHRSAAGMTPGVYDLGFDSTCDRWFLASVHD